MEIEVIANKLSWEAVLHYKVQQKSQTPGHKSDLAVNVIRLFFKFHE